MSIDFTKPLQTRDGRKVQLLCTDKVGTSYPVVVWLEDIKGTASYTLEGVNVIGEESDIDLMNVPEEVTVDAWVNVYPPIKESTTSTFGFTYNTKENAVKNRADISAVTIHIKRTVPVGHVDE